MSPQSVSKAESFSMLRVHCGFRLFIPGAPAVTLQATCGKIIVVHYGLFWAKCLYLYKWIAQGYTVVILSTQL